MKFWFLARNTMRGYSLLRAYQNHEAKQIKLAGTGIDLGAKSVSAKYYEYIRTEKIERLEFVDYFRSGPGIIRADLEQKLAITDEKYDFVLLFNVAEHIFNFDVLFAEIARILKSGGQLHLMVPFMYHFHADPSDYFRYSDQALEKILTKHGLKVSIRRHTGYGRFHVAAESIFGLFPVRFLRLLGFALFVYIDRAVGTFVNMKSFALGYYIAAEKVAPGEAA